MKLLLSLLLVGCAASQHPETVANPTCGDVVEHGYAIQARDLRGEFAIAARREFTKIKPEMITRCERADLTIERKRCIMAADSKDDAAACKAKYPN